MKKFKFLAVTVVMALVLALVCTTCDMEEAKAVHVDTESPQLSDTPAESEVVVAELNEDGVLVADVQISIEVAEPTDGGKLSFQWYKLDETYSDPKGEAIPGKTTATLTLTDVPVGVFHVYLEITNTNPGASGSKVTVTRSPMTTVTVLDPDATVALPIINTNPADDDAMEGEVSIGVDAGLPADAEGSLSYQWFSNSSAVNTGGTAVTNDTATSGATTDTLKVQLTKGTYFYYVVVTNTTAAGTKTRTSHAATITVIDSSKFASPNATITFNLSRKYQYVRGFGGMDIPWSNFTAIELDEYKKMFTDDPDIAFPNRLGFNMIRIMIMPGVIPAGVDEVGDVPGTEFTESMSRSDVIENTMKYYTNTVAGNAYRPNYYNGVKIVNENNGYVLASPWSPPPKWKTNNSKNGGGKLRTANYQDYADYLKRFAQHMYDHGAPIYAISIQNEPNFTARYDGCEWTSAEMRDFFKEVGHFTGKVDGTGADAPVPGYGGGKEIPVVLTMNGESANHPNINDAALDDPVSCAAIDVLGRHTYGDAQNRYKKGIDEYGKEVWMTEHNINSGNDTVYPNDHTWNYVWPFLNDVDLSIRLNDESAFIWWALRRFYSFVGEGQYGTTKGNILARGYALSHYAKFAKEMTRVGVSVSGTLADGKTDITSGNTKGAIVNSSTLDRNGKDVKITGFMTGDGNTLSLVMYTPTDFSGKGGRDMGTVEISMPRDFKIASAVAMRSTKEAKAKRESVAVSNDKTKAYVTLPPSNILSVRFTKAAN